MTWPTAVRTVAVVWATWVVGTLVLCGVLAVGEVRAWLNNRRKGL